MRLISETVILVFLRKKLNKYKFERHSALEKYRIYVNSVTNIELYHKHISKYSLAFK